MVSYGADGGGFVSIVPVSGVVGSSMVVSIVLLSSSIVPLYIPNHQAINPAMTRRITIIRRVFTTESLLLVLVSIRSKISK